MSIPEKKNDIFVCYYVKEDLETQSHTHNYGK